MGDIQVQVAQKLILIFLKFKQRIVEIDMDDSCHWVNPNNICPCNICFLMKNILREELQIFLLMSTIISKYYRS